MKKLLNTLFVTSQGAYLSKDGEAVRVQVDGETKLHIPIHTLDGIVCFGQVMCTPFLLGLCGQRNVTVSFLTTHGRFLARVHGPVSGNVLLRREQYRRADNPESSTGIARAIVAAKVANSRIVLMRAARERSEQPAAKTLSEAVIRLARLLGELNESVSLDSVRGSEGIAAQMYFGVFDHLITTQDKEFRFKGRNRRPPLDNMNALLSFFYTLLVHDVSSALEAVGLDPAVGYLHRDRPGRPGLALDLMEEFRPFLADRLAVSLVNRQQLRAGDFRTTESGAVLMDDESRKKVLVAYQKRKMEKIRHPFIDETIEIGLLPYVQAMLMARFLRGDLDGYPPFLWK